MYRRAFAAWAVLALAGSLNAVGQTLTWIPNSESDLAGYRVYEGSSSRNYTVVVDVGNTTAYEITSLPPGPWCFAVTAYNTSGLESAFSEEVCARLGNDSAPPVLTTRARRIATSNTVTIAWTTDEPAKATIEYGVSTDYGSSVATENFGTAQSMRLAELSPATTYHYRLLLTDNFGNSFVAQDGTFSTAPPASSIVAVRTGGFPRPVGTPFVGLGLTNGGTEASSVRLTPYDSSGIPVAEPVAVALAAGEQLVALDSEIFGDPGTIPDTAWIRVESSTAGTTGLFFGLDDGPTKMDGGTLPFAGLREFVLPGPGGFTIINPHPEASPSKVELIGGDGTVLDTVQRVIPGGGALASSPGLLFPGGPETSSGYLRVSSPQEVYSFSATVDTPGALAVVPGLDARRFVPKLYAPDFIGGPGWHSTITIINSEAVPGSFTARLLANDGTALGAKSYTLPALGMVRISELELIGSAPEALRRGYVEIVTNVAITGVLTIDHDGQAASAFELIDTPRQSFIIGQVASDSGYYTGAALLNPGDDAASVTLELHLSDGTLLDSWSGTLAAHEKMLQLMTQYFPKLIGKEVSAGYVEVTSDRNIAALALFGRNDLSTMSAIPPD